VNEPPDSAAIRRLWQTMADAWSAGSGASFAAVFADGAQFISVRGDQLRGRDEIGSSHAGSFAGRYRDTTLRSEVAETFWLTGDIVVVHARSTVADRAGTNEINTHAQAVLQRRGEHWEITHFHNMALPQSEREA
jgi:uncharacterized protein (TIGR02246 family)